MHQEEALGVLFVNVWKHLRNVGELTKRVIQAVWKFQTSSD